MGCGRQRVVADVRQMGWRMVSRWAADGQRMGGRWSADESQIATDGQQVGGRYAAYNVWAADAAIYVRICENVLQYAVHAAMLVVRASAIRRLWFCGGVLDSLCVIRLFVELRVRGYIRFPKLRERFPFSPPLFGQARSSSPPSVGRRMAGGWPFRLRETSFYTSNRAVAPAWHTSASGK